MTVSAVFSKTLIEKVGYEEKTATSGRSCGSAARRPAEGTTIWTIESRRIYSSISKKALKEGQEYVIFLDFTERDRTLLRLREEGHNGLCPS